MIHWRYEKDDQQWCCQERILLRVDANVVVDHEGTLKAAEGTTSKGLFASFDDPDGRSSRGSNQRALGCQQMGTAQGGLCLG